MIRIFSEVGSGLGMNSSGCTTLQCMLSFWTRLFLMYAGCGFFHMIRRRVLTLKVSRLSRSKSRVADPDPYPDDPQLEKMLDQDPQLEKMLDPDPYPDPH